MRIAPLIAALLLAVPATADAQWTFDTHHQEAKQTSIRVPGPKDFRMTLRLGRQLIRKRVPADLVLPDRDARVIVTFTSPDGATKRTTVVIKRGHRAIVTVGYKRLHKKTPPAKARGHTGTLLSYTNTCAPDERSDLRFDITRNERTALSVELRPGETKEVWLPAGDYLVRIWARRGREFRFRRTGTLAVDHDGWIFWWGCRVTGRIVNLSDRCNQPAKLPARFELTRGDVALVSLQLEPGDETEVLLPPGPYTSRVYQGGTLTETGRLDVDDGFTWPWGCFRNISDKGQATVSAGTGADLATDGDRDTFADTFHGLRPYWQLELTKPRFVTRITLRPRAGAEPDGFWVLASHRTLDNRTVSARFGDLAVVVRSKCPPELEIEVNRVVKYIRIQLTGRGQFGLSEVIVEGTEL